LLKFIRNVFKRKGREETLLKGEWKIIWKGGTSGTPLTNVFERKIQVKKTKFK